MFAHGAAAMVAGTLRSAAIFRDLMAQHRDAAPVVTWPDPLTRQCRRQLERAQGKVVRRRSLVERRKAVSAELKASRALGLSLPTWRARQAEITA